jgi:calcineurin-like phosphoesterase family protein
MSKIFFTSDLHFGHKNILSYDNRPFLTTEANDEAIIKNWNDKVGIEDTVWILGDVSWHNVTKTNEILTSLNGNKNLIIGNHDGKLLRNSEFRSLFNEIANYKEIPYGSTNIVLCHYPIPCFNRHYYGDYHLYGHVHISFEYNMMKHIKQEMVDLYDKPCNMYNAFIGLYDWAPVTLEEIIERNEK